MAAETIHRMHKQVINEIRAVSCCLNETHFTWFDFSEAICLDSFFSHRIFSLLLCTLDMFVYGVFSLQLLRRQIRKDTQCSATFYYIHVCVRMGGINN